MLPLTFIARVADILDTTEDIDTEEEDDKLEGVIKDNDKEEYDEEYDAIKDKSFEEEEPKEPTQT